MTALLDVKADPDKADENNDTLLMWAAYKGYTEILDILIHRGAQLQLVNKKGNTALEEAIINKKLPAVSLLLSKGALIQNPISFINFLNNCDQRDPNVLVSLKYVCEQLNKTKEIDGASFEFNNLLMMTQNYYHKLKKLTDIYEEKHLSIIHYHLIEDLSNIIFKYRPHLEHFIEFKPDEIDLLLMAECEPQKALFEALKNEKLSVDKRLQIVKNAIKAAHAQQGIKNSSESESKRKDLETLDSSPNHLFNLPDENGDTLLLIAIGKGYTEIVTLLLEAGADPNQANQKTEFTPLILAVTKNHTTAVRALLATTANVNKTARGETPLIWAAYMGDSEVANILIDYGATLETVNHQGRTALDDAITISSEKFHTVILLLKKGSVIRNPESLFKFLQRCDQQNSDVLYYLDLLRNQLDIKEEISNEKQLLSPRILSLQIGGVLGSVIFMSAVLLPVLLFCFLPTAPLAILLVVGISIASGGIGYWTGSKIQRAITNPNPVKSSPHVEESLSRDNSFSETSSEALIRKKTSLENSTANLAHQPVINAQINGHQHPILFSERKRENNNFTENSTLKKRRQTFRS